MIFYFAFVTATPVGMSQRRFPPPPTKFALLPAQRRVARPIPRGPVVPPPPTQFGPQATSQRAAAPQPGHAHHLPPPARFAPLQAPAARSRVAQASSVEEFWEQQERQRRGGDEEPPQMQMQAMVLLPRQQADQYNVEFQHAFASHKTKDGKGLVVSAPVIELRAFVYRDNLPDSVDPNDDFGWLQTIFESVQDGWYDVDPASWPTDYHDKLPWTTEQHLDFTARLQRHEDVDYQAFHQRIPSLPAADLGGHKVFYDGPTQFDDNPLAQQLFGRTGRNNTLGMAMVDKPQDVYALRTPDGIGRLAGYSGAFRAVAWFVAISKTNPSAIHYFRHVEWRIDYRGAVDPDGTMHDGSTKKIVTQGPGKGAHTPVIGGTPADTIKRVIEWSTPVVDPLGIL